jgi:hypothetical protein
LIEVAEGKRGYDERVEVARLRSNPFAVSLEEPAVEAIVRDIRTGGDVPQLMVARLPNGEYIDVDTPHACEAVKRAGLKVVDAFVVGTFTEEDCSRIGIRL